MKWLLAARYHSEARSNVSRSSCPKSEGRSAWPELGHRRAGSKQPRVGGGGGEGQVQRGLHLDKKDGAGLAAGRGFPHRKEFWPGNHTCYFKRDHLFKIRNLEGEAV